MSDTITTLQSHSEQLDTIKPSMSAIEIQDDSANGRNEYITLTKLGSQGESYSKRQPRSKRRTIRRLRGFLISFKADEAQVGFVEGKTVIEYLLPGKYLKASKITERGQPFEMDEFEEITNSGFTTGTEFRPIASSSAGRIVAATLSPEQMELRNAILAYSPFESKI